MSLFDSFKIDGKSIKNRILIPPFYVGRSEADGQVSHQMFEQIMRVVKQGAGTVILDSAYVVKQGRSDPLQLGISEEDHLPRLQRLVKLMKSEGVFCGIRLSHAGAKTNEKICGEQPLGPGMINFGKDYDISREFDSDDVAELCLFFAHAAERCEEIGLDFIELNGGQQQLFDQCLHLRYNQRDDIYGGKLQNRLKLACKIIAAMKQRVNNRLLMSYFFPIHDKLDDGFNAKELSNMIKILEDVGVDIFHPTAIHVMNKFFDNETTLLDWVAKYTKRAIIVEGNIKSTSVLKEVLSINKSTMYAIDKALYTRVNWFQFLQKKISN